MLVACHPNHTPAFRASPHLQALPLPAQCLYLRLFQRKGSLFRIASLAYKEVPDAAAAAKQLAEAGLAAVLAHEQCGNMGSPVAGGPGQQAGSSSGSGADSGIAAIAATDWRQLADLLTVPELAALLAARRFQLSNTAVAGVFRGGGNGAGGMPARNRQQLIEALERGAAPAQLATWLLQAAGPVLQLAEQACEAVERLQRLFFLNEGQSLSQVGWCSLSNCLHRGRAYLCIRRRPAVNSSWVVPAWLGKHISSIA